MQDNLLFEFTPANNQTKPMLSPIKQIGIDKRIRLSNESFNYTISQFGFKADRSPIVKRDLDRCDLDICGGKKPEKPVVPEDLPKEAQALYSIMNKFDMTQSELDSINFSLDNEGCILNKKLKSKGSFSKKAIRKPLICESLWTTLVANLTHLVRP